MKFLRNKTNSTGTCSANTDLAIFAGLSTKERAAADRFLNTVEVAAGKTLTAEGDTVRDFGVIISGQIVVTIAGDPIAVLDDGSQFGSVGILEAQPTCATFSALEPCTLAVCGRREFASLRLAAPALARRIDAVTRRREQFLAERELLIDDAVSDEALNDEALNGDVVTPVAPSSYPGNMHNWELVI